jgi:DNA-binding response OmpR family regulator
MIKILLIEDDFALAENIKKQLIEATYEVDNIYDGLLAEKIILRQTFDCIILDVNIPGKNGFELCKSIRQHNIQTPIIMLTAFGEVEDKLQGFDSGVDDYLTKPFFMKELLARIKVIIKRKGQFNNEQNTTYVIEDLVIDIQKKSIQRKEESIKLTAREFQILVLLAEAQGNPVSKKEIIQHVWGTNTDVNTNTIEVFVNTLRNKIDKNFDVKLIHTKLGFGYFLGKNHEIT